MTVFGKPLNKTSSIVIEILSVSITGMVILWFIGTIKTTNELVESFKKTQIEILYLQREMKIINQTIKLIESSVQLSKEKH